MNKFWKAMIMLLYVSAILTTFNFMKATELINTVYDFQLEISSRLSELENKEATVSIFVERYFDAYNGVDEYRVTGFIETPNMLVKSHE